MTDPTNTLPTVPAAGHLRVAHTADNHLRHSCHGSVARGRDFLHATLDVVLKAHTWGAHVLVMAGDLIDKAEIQTAVARDVKTVLDAADSLGLPLLTIQGNHDLTNGVSWPGVLGRPEQVLDNRTEVINGVRIKGLPFLPPDAMRAKLDELRASRDADILVWHGPIAELAGYESGSCLKLADFENLGTAAVLLGDIHKCAYVQVAGSGLLGYPGATEIIKKDEPLEHTFTLLDFAPSPAGWRVDGYQHVSVDSRPTKVLRIEDTDSLARAVNDIRAWRTTLERAPQLFVKYASDVPDVRASLAVAAGENAIVRAESFDRAIMQVVNELVQPGRGLPSVVDYAMKKLSGAWEQSLAARLISAEPGANYAEIVKGAVADLIVT